jgi:hypothetical protein
LYLLVGIPTSDLKQLESIADFAAASVKTTYGQRLRIILQFNARAIPHQDSHRSECYCQVFRKAVGDGDAG